MTKSEIFKNISKMDPERCKFAWCSACNKKFNKSELLHLGTDAGFMQYHICKNCFLKGEE